MATGTDEFSGRTALVTGGSRGIGRAICLILATSGVRVAINYRQNQDAAEAVREEVAAAGGEAITVPGDVGDPDEVDAMIETTEGALGPIDLLVCNAGISNSRETDPLSYEGWRRVMTTNVDGTFLPVMAVKDGMLSRGFGRIVCIASIAGLRSRPQNVIYATSKAAVIAFVRNISGVLAPGVRINAVAPGLIETDMIAGMDPDRRKGMIDGTPMGRIGQPEEIAETVLFLLSERSSFTTGQTLLERRPRDRAVDLGNLSSCCGIKIARQRKQRGISMKPALIFTAAAVGLAIASASAQAMPLQTRTGEPAVGARQSNTYFGPGSQARGQGRQSGGAASEARPSWMTDQEVMRSRTGGTEFMVRVENVSSYDALVFSDGSSQAAGFSHGVYAVHRNGYPVYRPGAPTPFVSGFEALAEDGNVRPMQPYLERHPDVAESGIFYKPVGSDVDAELWPGVVYEFRVTADPGDHLSFATMLMQSNDIIYGPRDGRIALFDADDQPMSGDVSAALGIFDAGTERNEDPKSGPNVGLNQSGLNTGAAEDLPVRNPDDGFAYPAPERVLRVTIQPTT